MLKINHVNKNVQKEQKIKSVFPTYQLFKTEAATKKAVAVAVVQKQVFLKISQNLQKNTCTGVSF